MIKVHAFWDNDAKVWVAESDDIPGLATESETMEHLIQKLHILIPELLEANGLIDEYPQPNIPFQLFSERTEMAKCAGYSPITNRRFVVDTKIISRHTA
jgi:predicted RNase H-like HicB family nuclease